MKLAAITGEITKPRLLFIPLHQELQSTLAINWQKQYDEFMTGAEMIKFDPGFKPEKNQCFHLPGYDLPEEIARKRSGESAHFLVGAPQQNATALNDIKGIVAFAYSDDEENLVLFQNFDRSHVIQPERFLLFMGKRYVTPENPVLRLDSKLSAVYKPDDNNTLLFRNFRTVNTFLSLAEHFAEASDQKIREVLSHELLESEDADAVVKDADQWSRKRFAMLLRNLDELKKKYPVNTIRERAKDYNINVQIPNGKIVFPADKKAAKKLLQFLNEELFRGAITNELYETNSKRKASD